MSGAFTKDYIKKHERRLKALIKEQENLMTALKRETPKSDARKAAIKNSIQGCKNAIAGLKYQIKHLKGLVE